MVTDLEILFFELLQVSIGTKKELVRLPSDKEWRKLYKLSVKHSLIAIIFSGITKLKNKNLRDKECGNSLNIEEPLYLNWLGLAATVAQHSDELNSACVKLCREFDNDQLSCCILKGQGNLEYYPEGIKECRSSGDIDVWCVPKDSTKPYCKSIIEYSLRKAQSACAPTPEVRYNNTEVIGVWPWKVEIHHRPSMMNSFLRNYRLQRWCYENEQFGLHEYKGFAVPTISFNTIYQLTHIFTHLFDEGVGLRQLMDYYFVLHALHEAQMSISDRSSADSADGKCSCARVMSNDEICRTLQYLGLYGFAGAVMYVLREVFAMGGEYMICEPDERRGRFLLDEVMRAGNFGQYDDRLSHSSSTLVHAWEKTVRLSRFLTQYPEEVLCEPFFRVYHWGWRKMKVWRIC